MSFEEILTQPEYDFLRENIHLKNRIMLLGIAGSYAYGTNHDGSDIDFRGAAFNRKEDLLGFSDFEQYADDATDTVIFGFNKLVRLLLDCNPNTIELLGLRPEHYLVLSDAGKHMVDHADMFLSRRVISTFGGYADAQLRRLQNALARDRYPQAEKEVHILNSVRNAMLSLQTRYADPGEGSLRLYIDKAVNPDMETEIFMDAELHHYPLRDYKNIWNEMHTIVRDYDKLTSRNRKKDDLHINKHAMHLIRLFLMGIDILEQEKVITYREREHELLMSIRNGAYMKEDGSFRSDFYDMVSAYEERFRKAAEGTSLPLAPDTGAVEDFVIAVNEESLRME